MRDNPSSGLHDVGYRHCDEVVSNLAVHADPAAFRASRFRFISAGFADRN